MQPGVRAAAILAAILAAVLAAAVAAAVAAAMAAELGSPVAGLDFARAHCARCHSVEPEGEGLVPSREIAFIEIARDPAMDEVTIRAYLRMPHEEMPNVMLTPEQTDNLVAYILSLKN